MSNSGLAGWLCLTRVFRGIVPSIWLVSYFWGVVLTELVEFGSPAHPGSSLQGGKSESPDQIFVSLREWPGSYIHIASSHISLVQI